MEKMRFEIFLSNNQGIYDETPIAAQVPVGFTYIKKKEGYIIGRKHGMKSYICIYMYQNSSNEHILITMEYGRLMVVYVKLTYRLSKWKSMEMCCNANYCFLFIGIMYKIDNSCVGEIIYL